MSDICDLILDDHEIFRRRFAELDDERHSAPEVVAKLWRPLAEHLERHAAAEEELFYPSVLQEQVDGAEHETHHAIRDHNKIREAVRRVADIAPGTEEWWEAVALANEENSDHMAEEERGPLSAFRQHGAQDVRKDLGVRYLDYNAAHAGGRDLDLSDTDPDEFVEQHTDG